MMHVAFDNQIGGVLIGHYRGVRFERRMYVTGDKVHFTYIVTGYSGVYTSLKNVKHFIEYTVLDR